MIRRSRIALPMLAGCALALLILLNLRTEAVKPGLCINEFLANGSALLTEAEQGVEWIELYNGTDLAIDLAGYGLSDDPDKPFQYAFGDVTIEPGGFVLASTDGAESQPSGMAPLSFRLSARGGCIVLTSPDGDVVDRFEYQKCYDEVSYGRAYDGGEPAILNMATPGYSNSASRISRYVTETVEQERPTFSHPGGFYDEPFELTIECPEGASVYYTTDGSVPDFTSAKYTGPILIEDASAAPNRNAGTITTQYPRLLSEFAAEPVTKGNVIRARICRDGFLSEYTADATYYVGVEPEVTTVSVITDPDNLFDYFDGIYTSGALGSYGPFTRYNEQDGNKNHIGNYTVRGKDAARPAHVEIFSEAAGFRAFGQNCDIRINGGPAGATEQVKQLRLCATSRYGDADRFSVNFSFDDERPVDTRELVLRTKRNVVTGVLEDVMTTLPLLNDNMYAQAFEPVSVYINGEYWGMAALRERITVESIAERFGLDEADMALLKYSDRTIELVSGDEWDWNEYTALQNYPLTHDMATEESYRYIADRIDMDSFIRSFVVHIYYNCYDWPDNNIRVFRSRSVDPDNPYGDGKWRFVLYDMDYACVYYAHNTLQFAMGMIEERGLNWPDGAAPEWSTRLFRGLMENATFRAQFLDVYREYRASIFQPDFMNALLDEVLDMCGSELQRHVDRWTTTPNLLGKLLGEPVEAPEGLEGIEEMRTFFEKRPACMDSFMEEFYASKGETILWE